MTLTDVQSRKLGPEWAPRTGLKYISELQRTYFAHAGSINFEDLREIAERLPGFEKGGSLPQRFVFSTPNGSVAFEFPSFYMGNAGPFTEGTTEVHTIGPVTEHDINCLAILLKDGMNGRHTRVGSAR